jgi:hypothetical protein
VDVETMLFEVWLTVWTEFDDWEPWTVCVCNTDVLPLTEGTIGTCWVIDEVLLLVVVNCCWSNCYCW